MHGGWTEKYSLTFNKPLQSGDDGMSFGFLISLLTFPGVMVHELGHVVFCWLLGIRVAKVCFFRFGNPAGYVLHEEPANALQHVLISYGPFIVNTVLGAAVAAPATVPLMRFADQRIHYLLIWLGVSIAMHAFPSTGDAASLWQGIWSGRGGCLWRLIALPFVVLIYLGALGSVFGLNVAYGIVVALYLPRFVMHWFGQ